MAVKDSPDTVWRIRVLYVVAPKHQIGFSWFPFAQLEGQVERIMPSLIDSHSALNRW